MPTTRFTFACVVLAIAAAPSGAQSSCEKLMSARFPYIKIMSATTIPAGPFTLPTGAANAASVEMPAFCRVVAVAGSEVRFELWMPAQWNTKLLSVGNGGLAGTISYAPMVKPLQQGYSTSSTDTDGSADRRAAITHPAEPAPTIT